MEENESVLSQEFLEQRKSDPPERYSVLQGLYWHEDLKTKQWIGLSNDLHDDYLKFDLGLSNSMKTSLNADDPVVSDVDWKNIMTRKNHPVEAAFDFDGLHRGDIWGGKYLNIGGSSLPSPEKGEFPKTKEALACFFGDKDSSLVFQSSPQHFYKDLKELRSTWKFPIIFIGDSRDEGEHIQDFYALLLGGRSIQYYSDKTDSRKLLASALWRIDRVPVFSQSATRAKFFNQFLTKNEVILRMGGDSHSIPCFAQKSIFLKKGARELLDLYEFSTEYNIHVLPLLPLNGYRFDAQAVKNELPAFMAYLIGRPAFWEGKYVAEELDQLLFEASPTGHFYALLLENASALNKTPQSIKDLQSLYSTLPPGDLHREMFKRDKANFPIYLEELSKRYPERIKRVGKTANWKFKLPQYDHEQSDDQ